jgi:two-component sensor histidine kinase
LGLQEQRVRKTLSDREEAMLAKLLDSVGALLWSAAGQGIFFQMMEVVIVGVIVWELVSNYKKSS